MQTNSVGIDDLLKTVVPIISTKNTVMRECIFTCIVFILSVAIFFTCHSAGKSLYIFIHSSKNCRHLLWQTCWRCCSTGGKTHTDKILRNITFTKLNILVLRNKISNSFFSSIYCVILRFCPYTVNDIAKYRILLSNTDRVGAALFIFCSTRLRYLKLLTADFSTKLNFQFRPKGDCCDYVMQLHYLLSWAWPWIKKKKSHHGWYLTVTFSPDVFS